MDFISTSRASQRALFLLAGIGLAVACSSDDQRSPPPGSSTGGSSGRGGSGSAGKGSGGASGSSGDGGTSNAGKGGGGTSLVCGDEVKGDDEECDGADFGEATCVDYGFDEGTLVCGADCTVDSSACSGTEHCADGRDNDGDANADCADDDCDEVCVDPCAAPPAAADPLEISASTDGRSDVLSAVCAAGNATPGGDVVYAFTAANTGTLEIELESGQNLAASVYSGCEMAAAELACAGNRISLPVTAGDELFIAVQAPDESDSGTFTLRAFSRPNDVCGDGYRDNEACDDGNDDLDDGCDMDCHVELAESEPNDDVAGADDYVDGFFAEIAPEGDVDVVVVDISASPGSIVARVDGFAEDCFLGKVDSVLDLYESDGTTLVDSDDDGGDLYCSRLLASGLAAGTYYLQVSASSTGNTPTFPYILDITVNTCGDGVRGPGEQCDDGDQMSGDGCSSTCQNE